jgi:hypothetical protein
MNLWQLTLVVILATASSEKPTCKTASGIVESTIEAKARELNADEYCQFRRYLTQDIDGDGVEDLLVIFGVERRDSANDSVYFLAAFPSTKHWHPALVKVGRRGERFPQSVRFESGKIIVETLEYGKADPMCCPTRPARLLFRLEGGVLVSVKAN